MPHKHAVVKLTDKITILKSPKTRGHEYSYVLANPEAEYNAYTKDNTIADLLDLDYHHTHQTPEDSYFLFGTSETPYRYKVNDVKHHHLDKFKFGLMAMDIDLYNKDGRTNWGSAKAVRSVIRHMKRSCPVLRSHAATICSSRGGIRIVFVLSHYVNALEWAWLYSMVMGDIRMGLKAKADGSKVIFKFDGKRFVFDGRYSTSLTRVPFGFRDDKPVTSKQYFYHETNEHYTLPYDQYGLPQEIEIVNNVRRGYTTVNLQNCGPRPEVLAMLPHGVAPFRWVGGEAPGEGERDETVFQVIAQAKTRFVDTLTPEQYYSYFHSAMNDIAGEGNWLDVAWEKICRDFFVASEAETPMGRRLDIEAKRNAGNQPFFPPTDFDTVLQADEVFDYANAQIDKHIETIIGMEYGTVFFNPPPGSGKSTASAKFLQERGGLYVAPTNAHINAMAERLEKMGVDHGTIKSYGELILEFFPENKPLYEIHRKYSHKYASAQKKILEEIFDPAMHVRHGRHVRVKSFPLYCENLFEKEAEFLEAENRRRLNRLKTASGVSLITYAKLLTCFGPMSQGDVVHPDKDIIFDEAEPHHVTDPDTYSNAGQITVYGKAFEPKQKLDERQSRMVGLLQDHYCVFINASKGLDMALTHNGFSDVLTLGDTMQPVLDRDLHIVLSQDLRSGYAPYKSDRDKTETSPRAHYCDSVNNYTHTLFANGKDRKGKKLSEHNLVNVVGSNAFINSKVISIITYPDAQEVAELSFCTGKTVATCIKIIMENMINQVVSRNSGYRNYHMVKATAESWGSIPPAHRNQHIIVLPEAVKYVDPELIVRTTNVWTAHSKRIPDECAAFVQPAPIASKVRSALYNIEPGSYMTLDALAKRARQSKSKVNAYLDESVFNTDLFRDFEMLPRVTVDGVRMRNVIRRHETVEWLLGRAFEDAGTAISMTGFVDLMKAISNENYIDRHPKDFIIEFARISAYRHEYRPVYTDAGDEYLVRTGAEDLFVPEKLPQRKHAFA